MRKLLPLLLVLLATVSVPLRASEEAPMQPLYDIGPFHRAITTKSAAAQRYFDQGLALLYAFNHDEAIRAFEAAARLDPDAAMPWWGIAAAAGPHINYPAVPPEKHKLAREALGHAQRLALTGRATPVERALINAQIARYNEDPAADRAPLDRAYAQAMREVWRQFPQDADVGALFAESMMNLRPWDLWQSDGTPQPGTDEILATLDAVLALAPNHPQALHLTVHAREASPTPESALPAADRLRHLQPGLGHMVHMPSHIDVRTGRWQDCIDANTRAIEADLHYRRVSRRPDGFIGLYMAHNRHMLAYGAMMTGQSALALAHIHAMVEEFGPGFVQLFGPFADVFGAVPLEVMVRFGRWDQILAAPAPVDRPFSKAMWHAARGIAHAAKGNVPAAKAEQEQFLAARRALPADYPGGINLASAVLDVAEPMLAGEILFRAGQVDAGLERLREAVRKEDALRYNEPPDWSIPVRHALGASLMQVGRYAEAEQVYRADLRKLPGNGWSLFGLSQALRQQGKVDEAKAVRVQFEKVWAKADIDITSSCLCLPGTPAK
jgi:tetratricopeptide (TPR) repeat protein